MPFLPIRPLFSVALLWLAQDLRPGAHLMAGSKARFLELLRLRYSSPLFRLPTAAHIKRQLRFHDTGPQQASPSHLSVCCVWRPPADAMYRGPTSFVCKLVLCIQSVVNQSIGAVEVNLVLVQAGDQGRADRDIPICISCVSLDLSTLQSLGVIVLELVSADQGDDEGTWDPLYSHLVLVFNARAQAFQAPWPQGALARKSFDIDIFQCCAYPGNRNCHHTWQPHMIGAHFR